ncbi:MAG: ATP-binding cassette domain-containing protein [Cyclobacteriaceae bacterium]|nr:ATP-binding cassette domain-containing protein [Cyclobacteriaceae bacterium SS2]
MTAIRINSLQLSFNARTRLSFPNWTLEKTGEALILGPSGSGKTTLLHLLSGLVSPTAGQIEVNGCKLHEMSGTELDRFRKEQVGIVFQQPHLIKSLSVIENLQLARHIGGQEPDNQWIGEIIEQLDLGEIKDRNVKKISQGQAQRVAIARSIMNRPTILFGDEPTASLDDENCEKVISLLKQEARLCGATLIIATHDQRVKREFAHQLLLKRQQ